MRGTLLLAGLLLGFLAGWTTQGWRWDAADAERAQMDRQARDAAAMKAEAAASEYEARRESARVEFRTITQEVERVVEKPVYRNVCLDDDGLRILRAAAGASAAAGQPGATLPGPDAAR